MVDLLINELLLRDKMTSIPRALTIVSQQMDNIDSRISAMGLEIQLCASSISAHKIRYDVTKIFRWDKVLIDDAKNHKMALPGLNGTAPELVTTATASTIELSPQTEWRFEVAFGSSVEVKVGPQRQI